MINLQNNHGPEALNEGAEIRSPEELHSLTTRQAEPLTDEAGDLDWAGSLTIGTPGQKFMIDFDSKCHSLDGHR